MKSIKSRLSALSEAKYDQKLANLVKAQNGMFFDPMGRYYSQDAGINTLKAAGAAYLGSRVAFDDFFASKIKDPEEAKDASNRYAAGSAALAGATSIFSAIGEARDYKYEMKRIAERKADEYYQVPRDRYAYDSYADNSFNNVAYKEGGMVEEPEVMRDGGIPQRYKSMGFSKAGQKKKSTRPGKKWMVLAKKGDDYKVVHGGDSKMKDFKQHKSEKRRERFWDRMGGRSSLKAKDPFSPLYWHKKFGTW
jgi:hypothetical protein